MAVHPAFSQYNMYSEEPRTFTGALVAGANISQIDGDAYYGYHKIGVNTGAQVYAHFTARAGLSLELLYSQKGSRGQGVVQSPIVGTYVPKYYMFLNYLDVPLTLHFIIRDFDLEAGAAYCLLLKSREEIVSDNPVSVSFDRNSFNATNIDFVSGISHKVYKNLYGNFRFQYSLTRTREPERVPWGYGYGNNGQFNNLISLRLLLQL